MKKVIFSIIVLFTSVCVVMPVSAEYCEVNNKGECYYNYELYSGDCSSIPDCGPYPEGPGNFDSTSPPPTSSESSSSESSESDYSSDSDTQSQDGLASATANENRVASNTVVRVTSARIRTAFAPRPTRRTTSIALNSGNSNLLPGITTGIASGDEAPKLGLWLTPSVSWLDDDNIASQYDGNLYLIMVGADYKVTDRLLLGVSTGYEDTDLDTQFNDGTFQSQGFTIAPYIGFVILDGLTADAILAYTFLNNDVERDRTTGQRLAGDYDSGRSMVSANLNYYTLLNNWSFSGIAGYMYVSEDQDAYIQTGADSNSVDQFTAYLGEWRLGGRAGYLFDKFEPYIAAAYLYDNTWNSSADDRDELEGAIGLDFYPTDAFIGSVEATHSFFRDDIANTRILLNLRYEF
ncbi:autotransporter outer membrane beta-barrel domain-containing protein [Desulfococcaceae bacterium HSG9]|nr:autotransporter outer membrane beta-barrel domain-containing protein [Desulfococcaceae bacterium HSG9]